MKLLLIFLTGFLCAKATAQVQVHPILADLEQFILTDIGSHILDITQFLFGEAESLYCQTAQVNLRIKGENVANVLLRMQDNLSCYVEMSYASILEKEAFPQTLVSVEADQGDKLFTGVGNIPLQLTKSKTYENGAVGVWYQKK